MKTRSAEKFPRRREIVWAVLLTATLAGLLCFITARRPAPAAKSEKTNPAAASAPQTNQLAAAVPVQNNESFRKQPFAATLHSRSSQWTVEDGKDPNVIRQLAHNDREYQRMVEENPRIKRRQLVYRNETTAALIERAKLSGETVQRLTLPGLDGQEVTIEITRADLNPSGQQGAFAGRVVGRDDSFVTLAFKGGREAFTVLSPTDGLFLQAEPREPGEVIVKSIDPDVYASGYCGNP